MNRRVWQVAVGLALALALFLALRAQQAIPAASALEGDDQKQQVISVSGEGTVTVKPDVAYVGLGVQTDAATAQGAQGENARLMDQVLRKLQEAGISMDKIKTANFNLQPVWAYEDKGAPRLTGYRAYNNVLVTVDNLDNVGKVIDAAVSGGANTVNEVTFSLKNPAQAYRDALASAVTEARAKADTLATALRVTIKGTRAVGESGGFIPGPIDEKRMIVGAGDALGTPINPGDLKVTARVQIEYVY